MALIKNKKIHLNYEIKSKLEAGLQLTGNEVKAIRNSQAQIAGAKVIIRGAEAYLVGMQISPYQTPLAEEKVKNDRTRKLLLKKSEILKLATETEKGFSLVPINIYDSHGLLKLEIALVKRKNKTDKRETLKKKDFERESKRN